MHAINIGHFVCACVCVSLRVCYVGAVAAQHTHFTVRSDLFFFTLYSFASVPPSFFLVFLIYVYFFLPSEISSIHNEYVRKKDQLRHFHATIEYICMRTHDSDKWLWWYSKWRVTRWKSETQNNRQWFSGKREQQQKQGTVKEFNFIDIILYTIPTRMTHTLNVRIPISM